MFVLFRPELLFLFHFGDDESIGTVVDESIDRRGI